jgi:hypothetical protein
MKKESSDSSIDDDAYLDEHEEDPMTDQQTQNNNNNINNNQTSSVTTSGNTLPIKATGNAARSVIYVSLTLILYRDCERCFSFYLKMKKKRICDGDDLVVVKELDFRYSEVYCSFFL